MSFVFPIRVYWEDTDAGGIVFYANYLKFMERARSEWLRSLGLEQRALKHSTGGMFVVTQTQLKYLQPARLDDLLEVSCRIVQTQRASLLFSQEIRLIPSTALDTLLSNDEQPNDASKSPTEPAAPASLLCTGQITIAWVNANSLKAGRIPTSVMELLQ